MPGNRILQGPSGPAGGASASGAAGVVANILANPFVAINPLDPVEIGPGGYAYRAQVTDYAAVANAGTVIVAATGLPGGMLPDGGPVDRPPLVLADGSIVIPAPFVSAGGLTLYRYSAAGALLASVKLVGSGSIVRNKIALLTNGAIAVVYTDSSAGLYFAVVNSLCSAVLVGPTSVATVSTAWSASGSELGMVALSGGGFAVAYPASTGQATNVAIYSNAGAAVAASTAFVSWGSAGSSFQNLIQLSSGNLALVTFSAATTALYLTILSNTGSVVVAQATVDSGVTVSPTSDETPQLSALVGYFAIASNVSSSVSVRAYVYSNAGALQGSAYSLGSGASHAISPRVINDGTYFWLLTTGTSTTVLTLVQLSTAGAAGLVYTATIGGSSSLDVFSVVYDAGRAVMVWGTLSGSTTLFYAVVNLASGLLTANAAVGALYFQGRNIGLRAGGDATIIAVCDDAGAHNSFAVVKYADTAFLGVALGAGAGSLIQVAAGAGVYQSNAMTGSPSKAFNHNSSNIVGNAGALLAQGVVLTGI